MGKPDQPWGKVEGQRPDKPCLNYLERVHDIEGGQDRGALSNKEVLVYAPMKTGSVSIFHAILRRYREMHGVRYPQEHILHNHHDQALRTTVDFADASAARAAEGRFIVRDLLDYKHARDEPLWVVSSFRDPFARAVSYLFGEITKAWRREGEAGIAAYDTGRCRSRLRQLLRAFSRQPHSIEELEPDFFEKHTFDHSLKSCHARIRGAEVLLVNLENVQHWSGAFHAAFDWQGLDFGSQNSLQDRPRPVQEIHSRFQHEVRMEESEIERLYFGPHPLARQLDWFYTAEEREGMFRRAMERFGQKD